MKQPLALIIVDTLDIASLDFRQTLDAAGYLTELMICDQVNPAQIAQIQPGVIFLHYSLSEPPCIDIFQQFQEDKQVKEIPVIALVSDNDVAKRLYPFASVVLLRPIAQERLTELFSSLGYVDRFIDKTPWDALTGLYTPTFFRARLKQAIKHSQQVPENQFIVFSINLDQLMSYEKKFGKEYRQHLLQGAAGVLKKVLRPEDIVARFESDHFMVLIEDAVDRYAPLSIVDRMQFEFDEYLVGEGLKNRIKIEMGAIYCTSQYKSVEDVLGDVNLALRLARGNKAGNFTVYERTTLPNQPSGIRSLAGV